MCYVCSRKIAVAIADFGTDIFLRADARSFAWFRLCCVILPFGFPFVISGACLGGSVSSVDYRSEGMLIQFPPGRGKRPCRFNSESETRVSVSVFFLYGFSLIVRLVREVIKIVDARLEETQVGSKTEGLATGVCWHGCFFAGCVSGLRSYGVCWAEKRMRTMDIKNR